MPFRVAAFLLCALPAWALAQIPRPDDAPQPLSPEESAARVQLPPGFRLELIAAEPLVREPSGVCWDEWGRTFVCELHGYNLEGQYDIEELNKTGELDRVVRRIDANEAAQRKAARGQTGTLKLLVDSDGDGAFDAAEVWSDDLPPCFGICAARGGIVVVCAPDIVFLADRDGDGKPDVRETLYTGFDAGKLERRMNAPQHGIDGWIYIGRGTGGRITGPRLAEPVDLPRTDFRIKADGTAIEPVTGGTHTFGFAFNEAYERFTVSTAAPAIYVAPLPWRYLARNPHVAIGSLEAGINPDQRTYPISRAHPWRSKRAEDPGFSKYYTDHYGITESAPNGYFTSACSPLIYQDVALPGLAGQLLACEPAQNLVHRAVIERKGLVPRLRRAAGEEESEFLASSDAWFHPMALAHAPDGSVAIVDFYREIIEDYSAIPRYLQQQYGLIHGQDHGRVWRLVHEDAPAAPATDMSGLSAAELVRELKSPHFWRRETARRLLVERGDVTVVPELKEIVGGRYQPAAVLNGLYVLERLGKLTPDDVLTGLSTPDSGVHVHALRLAESWLDREPRVLEAVLALKHATDERVLIQLTLTLGESRDSSVVPMLAELAMRHEDVPWMDTAVLSSLASRGSQMLAELLQAPGNTPLLEAVARAIAAGRDAEEISAAIETLAKVDNPYVLASCLRGLASGVDPMGAIDLSDGARRGLQALAQHEDRDVRSAARRMVVTYRIEVPVERQARLDRAIADLRDVQVPLARKLDAVEELVSESDESRAQQLLGVFEQSTPAVQQAILDAVLSRRETLPLVVTALEEGTIPTSALSPVHREGLLERFHGEDRQRIATWFARVQPESDAVLRNYMAALSDPRDLANGERVFQEHCATCHQAHGIGHAVGPDLTAESRRAEETLVQDILAPSAAIASGYATYLVQTHSGRSLTGLLPAESPSSVTLRREEGKEQVVLRKDIESLQALNVSLMPEGMTAKVRPQDVADVIAWLRRPPRQRVLFDEDRMFAGLLHDGEGTATIVLDDCARGFVALRVTPPQRFAAEIPGWRYRIREHPAEGEYRYVSFAWKAAGASGVMIELANDGRWPPANESQLRYFCGANTTEWEATQVSDLAPEEWTMVTRDLWKDFGDCVITGIAPTAMGGPALFDRIELLQSLPADDGHGPKRR